jgi:hypothetical protein
MASSLDPSNFPESRMRVQDGHGSRSLGPSDSSDSGSDLAGPGLTEEDDVLSFDGPPEEDAEAEREEADAVDLDDSSDRYGTGVRSTAGRSPRVRDNADRDADRVMNPEEPGLGDGLDQAEEEAELGLADEEIEEEDDDDRQQR